MRVFSTCMFTVLSIVGLLAQQSYQFGLGKRTCFSSGCVEEPDGEQQVVETPVETQEEKGCFSSGCKEERALETLLDFVRKQGRFT